MKSSRHAPPCRIRTIGYLDLPIQTDGQRSRRLETQSANLDKSGANMFTPEAL